MPETSPPETITQNYFPFLCLMTSYWVRPPHWLKSFFPRDMLWDMPPGENTVYLTFDDGPHPEITPWVLQQLERHNAEATFFCVGNNVARYPHTYQQILLAGHATGNHTYNHLNGWHTNADHYISNTYQAARHIHSRLFRPPYGRLKLSQYRKLKKKDPDWKVCMWDILSGDFDKNITATQCLNNVLQHIRPGSIIVFHDSEKAFPHLKDVLPRVLEYCSANALAMKRL